MRRKIISFLNEKNIIIMILEVVLLLVCIYGVFKSCWMNSVGVSLWLDEAALAVSFSKRNIWTLTSDIFEWNQIAPVGWLYVNKIISIILGNTEFNIRIFSVFSYTATLFLVYCMSKYFFHMRLPLMCPAYIASMSFALTYSIMFKPYISDGMFTMLTITAYLVYKEKSLKPWILGIVWAVLLWFSNPVCFVAGGLILSELAFLIFYNVKSIKAKHFKIKNLLIEIKPWIVIGGMLVISFVVYYFYWLRPVAIGDSMQNFWRGQNFPLFPKSVEDLSKMKSMYEEIFRHFSFLTPLMMFGLITTFIYGLYKKSRSIIGLYIGIIIMLFASYINMFPVEDRMWYYFYPLSAFLFFMGIDKVVHFRGEKKGTASTLIIWIFGIFAITANTGFSDFSTADKVFRSDEETNYEVNFVRDNIQEDEKVYVYFHSIPGFTYNNGYDTYSIGKYRNNVIYGVGILAKNQDYSDEINNITNAHNCYIVMSHQSDDRIFGIKNDLPLLGWLELIKNDYSTPLLYWTDDINKVKSKVELSTVKKINKGEKLLLTVRIKNTGETIINSEYSRVRLISLDKRISYDIPSVINQGGYTDIDMELDTDSSPTFILVDKYGKEVCSNEVLDTSK